MELTPAILEAIANAADTHPATVRAAYAGANVRPSARRRIFDAVRLLGSGRWPFPDNAAALSGCPRARGAARLSHDNEDRNVAGPPPQKQSMGREGLGEPRERFRGGFKRNR